MKKSNKTIDITDKTIRAGHEVFQISNLTKVSKHFAEANNSGNLSAILVGSFISLVSLMFVLGEPGLLPILGLIAGGAIAYVGWSNWEVDRYGFQIETNAGSKRFFNSTSEPFIEDLILRICDIMNENSNGVSYTVNIDDKKITNNHSEKNITVTGSSNVAISSKNVEQSLSKSDNFENLLSTFFLKLREIDPNPNAGASDLVSELEAELNNPNASKATVRRLWDSITKKLPEATNLAKSLEKIVEMLS